MGSRWRDEWEEDYEVYSPEQVEAVLNSIGVEVKDETINDFISLCPFHGNTDSPAFSTSKLTGWSICFNPSCSAGLDSRLTLERLVKHMTSCTDIEARRLIMNAGEKDTRPLVDRLKAVPSSSEPLKPFSQSAIDKMHARLFEPDNPGLIYMKSRGFTEETLKHFSVGFTPETFSPVRKPEMVVVPAFDFDGTPVGLVGRGIKDKVFKNFGPEPGGTGFHKSKIIWNLQNAKQYSTVIIVESTFDAMTIHQAGYPNVVALLGGSLSREQENLLRRYFTSLVIMTDNETGNDIIYHERCAKCLRARFDMCQGHRPGRDLGVKIAERSGLNTKWAVYDDYNVYPRGVKDANQMTPEEIRQCLKNVMSHYKYVEWDLS